jgi:hypothetical protein
MHENYLSITRTVILSILLCAIYSFPTEAQWSPNPNVNNAICTSPEVGWHPTSCSDSSGGAIITWHKFRSGTNWSDIFAQRINVAGVVQWTANGVAICTASETQNFSQICSDDSGGAIITWEDWRPGINKDIYAQRINGAGVVQWTANGVAIGTATENQSASNICSDGSGGAIITWDDERSGTSSDIYAQRINGAGVVQWKANGVAIGTATENQSASNICSDGSGGAIITWEDERSGTNSDIYAQRINGAGVVQWTANGVAICTATENQSASNICSDGSGGAIITWTDWRPGINRDIYAQRINGAGVVQWTANGEAVTTAAGIQRDPRIVCDGSGRAIIAWHDHRGSTWDVYASKLNPAGQLVPIELVSFSATIRNSAVTLSWRTATEVNNYGFDVERKIPARPWETIGFAEGHGTSNMPQTYQYQDNLIPSFLFEELILYRLRQIDMNGNYEYSPIVEVELGSLPQTPELHPLYPNPTSQRLMLPVFIPDEMPVTITMYTLSGQKLITVRSGAPIRTGYHVFPISTAGLPSGMYLVEMVAGDVAKTQMVTVSQ